jgi:hypothetical protein
MDKRSNNIALILSGVLFFLIVFSKVNIAQGNFIGNANLLVVGGNFSDGTHYVSTYVYGGLRYQEQRFYLSANIPIVFAGNGSFTQVGGIYIPNKHNGEDSGGMWHDNSNDHGSMMDDQDGMMSSFNPGIGDLYLYGSYKLFLQENALPEVSLDSYIKFPTATPSLNIGTGKFDFNLAVSLRKTFDRFLFYTQLGYLFVGKTEGTDVVNPVTFSIGIGAYLGNGNHAILAGYDSYSTIVNGFASPKQVAIGYSYIVSPTLSYNFISSFGLNSSTSDFSISGGINFGI